jgi:lipopolysaccharide biosynthesis glycosyltransferase
MAAAPKVCAVLAADSKFFHQTQAAIESIRQFEEAAVDIRLITIGPYPCEQLEWLDRAQVTTFDKIGDLPKFRGAPLCAMALTCRPYLPQIFPDVDGFVWVDADVRFLLASGLATWTAQAADPGCPVAAVQESEPAYNINADPGYSRSYHEMTTARMRTVYGDKIGDYLQYFKLFNAGVFAMHARSGVWARYQANLEKALEHPFDRMREQDAFNVAIIEAGAVRSMPSTLNWLYSLALPVNGPDGQFFTPNFPQRAIEVLHLSNSANWGQSGSTS